MRGDALKQRQRITNTVRLVRGQRWGIDGRVNVYDLLKKSRDSSWNAIKGSSGNKQRIKWRWKGCDIVRLESWNTDSGRTKRMPWETWQVSLPYHIPNECHSIGAKSGTDSRFLLNSNKAFSRASGFASSLIQLQIRSLMRGSGVNNEDNTTRRSFPNIYHKKPTLYLSSWDEGATPCAELFAPGVPPLPWKRRIAFLSCFMLSCDGFLLGQKLRYETNWKRDSGILGKTRRKTELSRRK